MTTQLQLINIIIIIIIIIIMSVRMERRGSHWTIFHEIWHLGIFRKFLEKMQVSFQYDSNNRYSSASVV